MSLQDSIWLLTSIEFASHYFIDGNIPQRFGNGHPAMTPGNLYPAKDGSVRIDTGVLHQIERLYRAIGREDLIGTPLCSNQRERIKHRDEIDSIVRGWTETRTTEEIVSTLKNADVPCVRIPTFDEVCNDPHLISREMIIDVEQTISGRVKTPGSLFKLSQTPGNVNYPAPYLGEHNKEVYSGMLGYSEEEINSLARDGII
jgi:crotonobetainyl-CoA:carnitine CoA-transferase CaiB-like acyl-CoA transferase